MNRSGKMIVSFFCLDYERGELNFNTSVSIRNREVINFWLELSVEEPLKNTLNFSTFSGSLLFLLQKALFFRYFAQT